VKAHFDTVIASTTRALSRGEPAHRTDASLAPFGCGKRELTLIGWFF
jgi:hypothetical protein